MGKLKKTLKSGEPALGTWITINHPDVVDALSEFPFDWFVFDMEHAPLEISDIEVLMMPLRDTEITPLIRVPWNDMVMIKRALDVGAEGIVVPWVNSREEAEAAVKYASYPPRGLRGAGPRRCVRYGERSFLDYYGKFEKEERVIVVQIETQKALDNLDEILSTQGIDVAFVGPLDLTTNLGIPTQYDNPRFKEALEKILKTCQKYDVAPGIYAFSLENAEEMVSKGFRFVSLMSDVRMLRSGYREALKKFGRE
ncbi:MAG: 2,4-dihydroxyhept-2-ene-1,7-dioic acid aldolase [Thaumarchaeota archaeon]|nr:2,4-dihydroxyhept-2-ene-1,7-dioic acid aldolase [Nitrososphaerota archaeon]